MSTYAASLIAMQSAILQTFGLGAKNVTVQFTPQDGSGVKNIDGVLADPAMEEDKVPGSTDGAAVLRLYVVLANITPTPRRGDVITVNGVHYEIADAPADRAGGAILKLRIF
jgi:hypothetical protein